MKGCVFFMQKNLYKTKVTVTAALLIALNIVLARFASFQTLSVRISFGFLPTALCSMLFGPWVGAVSAFLSDFLGMLINSKGMAYFPGYGLSEALYGLTYGLFLYKQDKSYTRIILCVLVQAVCIGVGLGSLWNRILYHNPYWTTLLGRLPSTFAMVPVKIFGIRYIWRLLGERVLEPKFLNHVN